MAFDTDERVTTERPTPPVCTAQNPTGATPANPTIATPSAPPKPPAATQPPVYGPFAPGQEPTAGQPPVQGPFLPGQGPSAPSPTQPASTQPVISPGRQAEIEAAAQEAASPPPVNDLPPKPGQTPPKPPLQPSDVYNGTSRLGKLTPEEQAYFSEQMVEEWSNISDPTIRNSRIQAASQQLANNPAARQALAQALAAPAAKQDAEQAQEGATPPSEETATLNAELLAQAAIVDPKGVINAYKGNEAALAQRSLDEQVTGANPDFRKQLWQTLAEPGSLSQSQIDNLSSAMFMTENGEKTRTDPQYREAVATALANLRRPGETPADKHARDIIFTNLNNAMATEGGSELLFDPKASFESRFAAFNQIAGETTRLPANTYAEGWDSERIKQAGLERQEMPEEEAGGKSEQEIMLDMTQMALDLVGIADPTGIADGGNAVISLFRGDFKGALISAASLVPYVGDLAKAGKLGKWAETAANMVTMAAKNPQFLKMVEGPLNDLRSALDKIPLDKLPEGLRKPLEDIKNKIDNIGPRPPGVPASGTPSTSSATTSLTGGRPAGSTPAAHTDGPGGPTSPNRPAKDPERPGTDIELYRGDRRPPRPQPPSAAGRTAAQQKGDLAEYDAMTRLYDEGYDVTTLSNTRGHGTDIIAMRPGEPSSLRVIEVKANSSPLSRGPNGQQQGGVAHTQGVIDRARSGNGNWNTADYDSFLQRNGLNDHSLNAANREVWQYQGVTTTSVPNDPRIGPWTPGTTATIQARPIDSNGVVHDPIDFPRFGHRR